MCAWALITAPVSYCLELDDIYSDLLSKSELSLIERFSNDVSIDDSVGQLLIVGAAGDSKNFNGNPHLDTQIRELGIGGLILNSYNYESKKNGSVKPEVVNTMIHYHNYMQSLSVNSPLKLPLFLAVDYEGPAFTSLPGGATQPPAALTLGSTQDGNLIRMTGKLVGYQLRKLGINMLLGPVLDVDRSVQGESDKTIRNRSFGGDPNRVYKSASHYTTGVREAGLLVIAKHFPGLGSVQGSLHSLKTLPTYYGGPNRLRDELLPYTQFSKYLDGVMTSHVYLDFIEQTKQKPITFSTNFVTKLLQTKESVNVGDLQIEGLGFKSQLIVSDDMTDMGSVM